MQCRLDCGACCIAPAIVEPFFNMPEGKRASERCVHLQENFSCAIFYSDKRPKCCAEFKPELEFCGQNREQALQILTLLEMQTIKGG